MIYHELGLQFLSPTINLFMEPKHFVRFLANPLNYYNKEMRLLDQMEEDYPVVSIEDIVLHCVHFHSLQEVVDKWNSRFERINWNNTCAIMSERDGCTEVDLRHFDELPYEHKVVFVHKVMPEIKSAVYLPGTELDGTNGHWVCPLTSYVGHFSGRRVIDMWDYVSFINNIVAK